MAISVKAFKYRAKGNVGQRARTPHLVDMGEPEAAEGQQLLDLFRVPLFGPVDGHHRDVVDENRPIHYLLRLRRQHALRLTHVCGYPVLVSRNAYSRLGHQTSLTITLMIR